MPPASSTSQDLRARLDFLREAERLKGVLRSGNTSTGRRESTAEHTWRLSLMALTFADRLGDADLLKVLQLCILHDLGEALHGDLPAPDAASEPDKAARERRDLLTLLRPLPLALRDDFLALWDEYEAAATREARIVKALDKLETLLQHNQGANPPDFDYAFNLTYGRQHTDGDPLFAEIRSILDAETERRAREGPEPSERRP